MKKVSKWLLAGALALPTPIVMVAGLVACNDPEGPTPDIPEDIHLTTTEARMNTELGAATFGVLLGEQPKDGKVLVTISKLPTSIDVRLVEPWDNLGIGVSSAEYEVDHNFFTFSVGYRNFYGIDMSADFNIFLEYTGKSGKKEIRILKNLKVFSKYEDRPEGEEVLHILDINDLHGAAPGYGDDVISGVSRHNPGLIRIADQMGETLRDYPGSIVLSAGDNATGDAFSTAMHGKSLFPVEKSLGVQYSAVGNHEFDWGNDQLAGEVYDGWGRTDKTNGKYYVASNILSVPFYSDIPWVTDPNDPQFDYYFNIWNNTRVKWADPYKLVNMDGHLICLFGLTTQATITDGNKDVVNHYSFIDYNSAVSYSAYLCQKELGPDWFNKIDCFLLLTHLECDQKIDKDGTRHEITGPAADLAKEIDVNWVDGIIAGHSHKDVMGTVKNHFGKDLWIGQGKNSGQQYVDTTLTFDNSKPAGQRLKSISMETKTITIEGSETGDEQKAKEQLLKIRANPRNATTVEVIDAYDTQRNEVADVLDHKIAETKYGCHYQVYHDPNASIGHKYFRPHIIKSGQTVDTYEDDLGAWINLAQLIGFSSKYQEEIEGIESNLKFPSISFINFDSLGGEIPGPTGAARKEVTLKDLFTIQGYENSITLGYLSVWQLANIINYLLAGLERDDVFHYDMNNEYFNISTCPRNDLEKIDMDDACLKGTPLEPIECIDQYETVEYKDDEMRKCNYLCGPLQWYGFKFEVEKCDETSDASDIAIGRTYKLKYEAPADTELANKYTAIPKIWIYKAPDEFDPSGLYDPDDASCWIPASEWIKQNAYIPCVINSFLFEGGNAQATMFKQYFEYNAAEHPKLYNIHHKVDITRDLLIEFCNLTSQKLPSITFDLPKDTYQDLVIYS